MFKTNAIVAAALCTVSLFAAPAAFAKSVEVSYKDLDLTTQAGQQTLEKRLHKAAREACTADRPVTGTRLRAGYDQICYDQALTQVRQHVATAIDKADDNQLGG